VNRDLRAGVSSFLPQSPDGFIAPIITKYSPGGPKNYLSFTVREGGISNTEFNPSSTLSGAILISSIRNTPPF